jgi:hypothetical protein
MRDTTISAAGKSSRITLFCRSNGEEIAGLLGVTPRTVRRDWTVARAWLYGQLAG